MSQFSRHYGKGVLSAVRGLVFKYIVAIGALVFVVNATSQFQARQAGAAEGGNAPVKVAAATTSGSRVVALKGDSRGHFHNDIQINGQFITALIDTGASIVAMSAEDAKKAGIVPSKKDYTMPVQTANGLAHAARVRIPELRLQSLVVRDVEAAVMPPGALQTTLLGMSFLKRLGSFEMSGATLVLKQ